MTFYGSLGMFKVIFDRNYFFRDCCTLGVGVRGLVFPKTTENHRNHGKSPKIRENRKIGVRKITFSTLSRCRIDLKMVPGCSPELFTPREDDISKSRFFGFFLPFHGFGPFFHLKKWLRRQMSGVPKGSTKFFFHQKSPKTQKNTYSKAGKAIHIDFGPIQKNLYVATFTSQKKKKSPNMFF